MCNLYNLNVDACGYFDALAAADDAANVRSRRITPRPASRDTSSAATTASAC
jgi:hypothetical protein